MGMLPTFRNGVTCELGNGNRIRFWYDIWAGDSTFALQFPRFLSLSDMKNGTVREMWQENCEGGNWQLNLRRNLKEWEMTMFEDLISKIDVSTLAEEGDTWIWRWSKKG
ncbi:hypothetical protein FRX31_033289, partial [Thalictrum thalictroides]